jgi:hypothetical protein
MEGCSTLNLAELVYFSGALDEALSLAKRADEILFRLHGQLVPESALNRARILATQGQVGEATSLLGALREQCAGEPMTKYRSAMMRFVELLMCDPRSDDAGIWESVVEELRACNLTDEPLDVMYQAASRAVEVTRWQEARRWIARALAEAGPAVLWRERLSRLAARLPPE